MLKRLTKLIIATEMLLMAKGAVSQDINLTFTGSTTNGSYVQLDSVRVQNVSRIWNETLVYPDTVLTFQQTSIADAQGSTTKLTSYPNPFNGTTNIAVTLTQSSEATMQIYNLAGQKVAERTMYLKTGDNLFEVRLHNPQVYLLSVTTSQGKSTTKLLNRGIDSENSILYHGNSTVIEKRLSTNSFQSGDVLKIIGYTTHNGETVASREVLHPQTASENFTLFFTFVDSVPTVITDTISNITDTSAVCGGNVISDGGAPVTARGVCWSSSHNPNLNDNHTSDSIGTGHFTSNITGLTAGTTYYIRAYATNAVGTAYGNEDTLTTWTTPTVTTDTVSNITDTSAVCGGNVTSDGGTTITARGVCWGTLPNPTISDSHTSDSVGTGHFTSIITGLTAGTTYYVRAYATNSVGTIYGNEDTITTEPIVHTFSLNDTMQVIFSPGNLQWSATGGGSTPTTHAIAGGGTAAGTWRFAPNQWDTIGAANANISSSYTGWIDLFGWGTSGYNNKYPYMTSSTISDYGNGNNDIAGTNYDWGIYNAIYNPKTTSTDAPGTWRTLTTYEWSFLLNNRITASGILYAKGTVNGISGVIILPDDWDTTTYALNSTNTNSSAYNTNIISSIDWIVLENAGAIFLPTAGDRDVTTLYNIGSGGYYWSASNSDINYSYFLMFFDDRINLSWMNVKSCGQSVRLIRNAN